MGRFYFHSTEAIWEMIAREEWLGCQHVASPMLGIPGSTPVWAQLYYFIFWFFFYDNKITCIMFLKAIFILYKITLVVSDLVLAR